MFWSFACGVRAVPILALCLAAVAPVQAQYMNPYNGLQFRSVYQANIDRILSESIQRKMLESAIRRRLAANDGTTASSAPAPATYRHAVSATDFVPAGKRRVAEQIAASSANAAERKQLIEACRRIQAEIENTPGFRKNNFANGLALLVGVSLQVLTGTEIGEADTEALVRDLNDQLASSEGYRRLSAEQRTAAYDTFVILGGLIAGIAQDAADRNDAQQAKQARELAREVLVSLGVEV